MSRHRKILDELDDPNPDDLYPVLERLETWTAPSPTAQDTARLLAALENESRRIDVPKTSWFDLLARSLHVLRGQMYVVRQELLAASALVMALGTLLSVVVPLGSPSAPGGLLLALAAPLIAAMGMSFLYGPGAEPVVEIERSTPTSQRKILLARMTLIFGFNLLFALAGSLLVAAAGALGVSAPVSFFTLVGIWLAPMAALSALAFVTTILSGDPIFGSALSLLLWSIQALKIFGRPAGILTRVPDVFALETRPALWLLAMALSALGFWIAERETTNGVRPR